MLFVKRDPESGAVIDDPDVKFQVDRHLSDRLAHVATADDHQTATRQNPQE